MTFLRSLPILLVLLAPASMAQDLPDWAAPSAPAAYEDAPLTPEMIAHSMAPTTPTGPSQVPLDGGVGLLALAGAAYAARRLRQTWA